MLERPAPRAFFLVFWAGLSAGVGSGVLSCNGGDGSAGEGAAPGSAGASASPDGGADGGPRRPLHRYYMAKTKERCEVYTVEDDVITPRGTAPCPAYIEVGERIRLAGFTCFREGTPGREQPVVCPGELLWADRDDRAARMDAGADADTGADTGTGAGTGTGTGTAKAPVKAPARKTPK